MLLLVTVTYNLGLFLGLVFGWPAALIYLALVPKARAGFLEKCGLWSPALKTKLAKQSKARKTIWFHAVSVGEFNAIRGVVDTLRTEFNVVISTTTLTSQTLARQVYSDLPVFYFPYDFWLPVQSVLNLVNPDFLILTETELWPNTIVSCHQKNIPVMMMNGRLSEKSFKSYARWRWFFSPLLNTLTQAAMQTEEDAIRIQQLGVRAGQSMNMGNLKFDVMPPADFEPKTNQLKQCLNFNLNAPVITFASTHAGEEELFVDVYQQLLADYPELTMVLVPRHPERIPAVELILKQAKLEYSLRSGLNENALNQSSVVLVDTIGELVSLYALSTVAVIGGSFNPDRGGQNPIEAISQNCPAVFGPHMKNFKAIVQLILNKNAGIQVENQGHLIETLSMLMKHEKTRKKLMVNGALLIENNKGALNRACEFIKYCLA